MRLRHPDRARTWLLVAATQFVVIGVFDLTFRHQGLGEASLRALAWVSAYRAATWLLGKARAGDDAPPSTTGS